MTHPEVRRLRPLCPVLVHMPSNGTWMTQEDMDEFVAAQREHFAAHGEVSPDQKGPMVQIERYDAAYGFDHAGSRQHDPMVSQAARLKSISFLDQYLTV